MTTGSFLEKLKSKEFHKTILAYTYGQLEEKSLEMSSVTIFLSFYTTWQEFLNYFCFFVGHF